MRAVPIKAGVSPRGIKPELSMIVKRAYMKKGQDDQEPAPNWVARYTWKEKDGTQASIFCATALPLCDPETSGMPRNQRVTKEHQEWCKGRKPDPTAWIDPCKKG
jgi:hypothetical protein